MYMHTVTCAAAAGGCRLLHEELKAAGSSGHLAGLVGSAVGKALRMIAEKAEYMAAAGPELRQVRVQFISACASASPAEECIRPCRMLSKVTHMDACVIYGWG
jgi:hypothetical protein